MSHVVNARKRLENAAMEIGDPPKSAACRELFAAAREFRNAIRARGVVKPRKKKRGPTLPSAASTGETPY